MIMEDKKNTPQFNTQADVLEIDLSVLSRDFLRSFGKLWWLTILLAAIVSVGALLFSIKSYQPMYKVETTFTVETYNPTQSCYTFFYDNRTAAQMALTFPYLLDSDLLLERVKAELGVEYLNGTPSAKVIKGKKKRETNPCQLQTCPLPSTRVKSRAPADADLPRPEGVQGNEALRAQGKPAGQVFRESVTLRS